MNKILDHLAMRNSVHWYGHVFRREDGHILRRVLDFEVKCQGKKGRLRRTWKMQVEEESMKVCLSNKSALCQTKWVVGVIQIAPRLRRIWHPHLLEILPDFYH